jgi:hypothetical protein
VAPRFISTVVGLAIAASVGGMACSFLVNADATQCSSDADCARFAGSVCNFATRLCRPGDPAGDGGGPVDLGGPPPVDAPGICFTFDNKTRLTNLDPDGGLKPLPEAPK